MNQYDWPYGYAPNPYAQDPLALIAQAMQQGATPQMPTFAQATPEQKSFGPAHGMLRDYFSQALGQQLQVPGLLSLMQGDPALAQSIGGLLTNAYTPPAPPSPYTIDWAAAEAAGQAMEGGRKKGR